MTNALPTGPAASAGTPSGTQLIAATSRRATTTRTCRSSRCSARTRAAASARSRTSSPTARRARCRTSRSSTRSSSGRSSTTTTRSPTSARARRSSATRSRRSPSRSTGTTASSSSPTTSGAASSTTCRRRSFADDRASTDDATNFGQGGFRVPTIDRVAVRTPGLRRPPDLRAHARSCGSSSGASSARPPEGPGKTGDSWFLTSRDRNALNLGASLMAQRCSDDIGFDLDVVGAAARTGVRGRRRRASRRRTSPSPPTTRRSGACRQALDDGVFERVNAPVLV